MKRAETMKTAAVKSPMRIEPETVEEETKSIVTEIYKKPSDDRQARLMKV